jgi:hypothetical protein
MTKEELRNRFDKFTAPGTGLNLVDSQSKAIFDFFWAAIEKRDKALIKMASSTRRTELDLRNEITKLEIKLTHEQPPIPRES